ncbi:MAG: hypothetical protein GTO51_02200 [Candidatus Latescibacteria bacterium]|nr:hypothetical protein [Candidatus Latescibacterota bacterium]NIM22425.1 hypothetical protein [Candidatus Latescibacterota bacterium]NIM64785.1 hypothetical protein [Candidatus Latescibacterota bacterium]NIO01296.1 hypothetical protein [Candidatus Latescibacterota bacterium]NIO27788.1 hypothetical protein [Candidatus Latescibacterota bacterium]
MKRSLWLLSCLLLVFVFVGCGGEDGPQGVTGPSGNPGSPRPIKLLLAGAESGAPAVLEQTALRCISSGVFPIGTEVNYIDITNAVPALSTLQQYDVVACWGNWVFTADPVDIGNVMADYVDAGGGVVISTYSFNTMYQIEGRIMTQGYSPFGNGQTGITPSGTIDVSSLALPLHPIFNGVDVANLTYWQNPNYTNPPLTTGAELLATDELGNNLIAINANEDVVGIVMYVPYQFWNGMTSYPESMQLFANACLIAGGAVGQ